MNTTFGWMTPTPPVPMRSITVPTAMNSWRRLTIVTFEENLARKIASSIAESPPPTMIVVRSL